MSRRSGSPARGPGRRSAVDRGLLLLCLAGCSGDAFLIGESATSNDGSFGGGRRPPEEDRCDDRAELRLLDSACWPTRHVGGWHGFVTTTPYYGQQDETFEYPSGEMLLEVSEQGEATLTFFALSSSGSSRPARASDAGPGFDAGALSAADDAGAGSDAGLVEAGAERAAAELDAGAARDAEAAGDRLDAGVRVGPPTLGLALGFPYPLRELRMSGGPNAARQADPLLDFSLLIAEPWSDSCAAWPAAPYPDRGPCVCGREDGGLAPGPSCGPAGDVLSVTLSLSADAQALRGSARSIAQAGALVAGWELVRE